ncbi:MAG: hypothetical protein ACO1NY_06635 [Pseudorhodoplanes sp.]
MKPRFKLRHAVVGYVVALVFAFNGLLTSVIDASIASGGSSFALITCLGGQVPGQQAPGQQSPAQSDHASKCSCNLSCCCANGALARNGSEVDIQYPAVTTAFLQLEHAPVVRDFRTDHPLHLRSPPAVATQA